MQVFLCINFLVFNDEQEPIIEIPVLARYAAGALTGVINYCSFNGNCRERYISINPDGDVYPCGKFSADGVFKLGNINSQSLIEIMNSETQKFLLKRNVNKMDGCPSCDYVKMCSGGCLYNGNLRNGNPFEKDILCEAYKMIYKHISERLDAEFKKLGVE